MGFSLVGKCAPSPIALLKYIDMLFIAKEVAPEINLIVFSKYKPSSGEKTGRNGSSHATSATGRRAHYHQLAADQNWPVYPDKRQPGSTGAFLNKSLERYVDISTRSLLSHHST